MLGEHKQALIARKEWEICLYCRMHVFCAALHIPMVTAQDNHTEHYELLGSASTAKNAGDIFLCFLKAGNILL